LSHISSLLKASVRCVKALDEEGRPVIVHCSDGWDRTPQIVSITQLLLDPYYRTMEGFQVLIEKDWLDFGHKMADRCGNAIASLDVNERSPIFLQWLDCVHQLLRQFPCHFEFNASYLAKLATHVYSQLFGTFLCNSMLERKNARVREQTLSVFDFLKCHPEKFRNYLHTRQDEVLRPRCDLSNLLVWREVYLSAKSLRVPAGPLGADAAAATAAPHNNGMSNGNQKPSNSSSGCASSSTSTPTSDCDDTDAIAASSTSGVDQVHAAAIPAMSNGKVESSSRCHCDRDRKDGLAADCRCLSGESSRKEAAESSSDDERRPENEVVCANGHGDISDKGVAREKRNGSHNGTLKKPSGGQQRSSSHPMGRISSNGIESSTDTLVPEADVEERRRQAAAAAAAAAPQRKKMGVAEAQLFYADDSLQFDKDQFSLPSKVMNKHSTYDSDGLLTISDPVQETLYSLIRTHREEVASLRRELCLTRRKLIRRSSESPSSTAAGSSSSAAGLGRRRRAYNAQSSTTSELNGHDCGPSDLASSWENVDENDIKPSLWAPPDLATMNCQRCQIPIWAGKRKYTCRHCARFFCRDCSENFIPVSASNEACVNPSVVVVDYRPIRVCDDCYRDFNNGDEKDSGKRLDDDDDIIDDLGMFCANGGGVVGLDEEAEEAKEGVIVVG
jgi:myotubularin-related protein 3/4